MESLREGGPSRVGNFRLPNTPQRSPKLPYVPKVLWVPRPPWTWKDSSPMVSGYFVSILGHLAAFRPIVLGYSAASIT